LRSVGKGDGSATAVLGTRRETDPSATPKKDEISAIVVNHHDELSATDGPTARLGAW
jgi:hypothetical protein